MTRLPFPVELPICPGRLELEENVHKMFFKYTIDYDKIQSSLRSGAVCPVSRLHPAGRGVGKSVKVLMNEQHIPPASPRGVSAAVRCAGNRADPRYRLR